MTTTQELQLPYKELDLIKDKRWNAKKVNAEMLQAIQNGESVDKMKKRLMKVTDMDKVAAKRNARTMHTSFQNLGRLDGMYAMKREGVDVKKRWLATHIYTGKHKTRKWHSDLDEQVVDLDEPFINYPNGKEKDEIMYPADPAADPANVYNCRCTLVSEVGGFDSSENYDVYVYDKGEENKIHYIDSNASLKEIKTLDGETIKLEKPLKYGELDKNIDEKTREQFEKFEYKYLTKGGGVEHEMSKGNFRVDARTGEETYELSFAKGTKGSVDHISGRYITHIHPREKGMLGGTFSQADLQNFLDDATTTVRAVAKEGTYSFSWMRGFNSYDFQMDVMRGLEKIDDRYIKKYGLKITGQQMNNWLIKRHNFLLENAKKYGYFYTLEMRGI